SIAASASGSNIVITFAAAANQAYSVLWRESVDLGKWTKLIDIPAQSSAHTETITDPLPPGYSRIYRIVTPPVPGPANPLPAIIESPRSATADPGGEATLQVAAVGTGTLTYEWSANSNLIANVNSPTL